MSVVTPKVVLRIGSHAEKEYFEKLSSQLDAIMFGGNLLEITPTATASLLALLREKRGIKGAIPYYLDPITYCFGAYIDPETGQKRSDLHAIKSERINRKTKSKFVAVKDSYMSLARHLGSVFGDAVRDGDVCAAINPANIAGDKRDAFCKGVLDYQTDRIAQVISDEVPADDVVMAAAFDGIGQPAAIFAPYFYVHESWVREGLQVAMDLVKRSVSLEDKVPVHAVLCINHTLLSDRGTVEFIKTSLPATKVAGVWLWFDGFDEFESPLDEIEAVRELVACLAQKMEVYNLHGGYYSLLLAHDGLTGISHGVGYGERKPVAQVIGAAAPTVRYYLPAIRRRAGVPDIQRCFPDAPNGVGIKTAADFFEIICDCTICRGVIGTDVKRFSRFGEMHRANEESKRNTQTATAAKICRFHFLLNRMKERDMVASIPRNYRSTHITTAAAPWRDLFTMRNYLGPYGSEGYIERWARAFSI